MEKHATVYDIAKQSGVSVATVSRVLSGSSYPVRKETREKVLLVARELRYTRNAMGRSLKTNTSRDIGVIIPNLTNPSYAMLLTGIQREASAHGYTILLCSSSRDAMREAANIQFLMEKRVSGILLTSISPDLETIERVIEAGFPMVTMEQELSPLSCIHVGYHYEAAGHMMTRHLIEKGHRKIGFIGAPLDRPSRRQILAGYMRAMDEASLSAPEEHILLSGHEAEGENPFEVENGMHAARYFLEQEDRPTAYACLNDLTALGAMRAFEDAGLSLPQDASIVGFDNIPYGALGVPALTTIDQHATKMGEIAARMLIEQIEDPDHVQFTVRLVPELVERKSVVSL